jgi:thioredoxin-dependent peroxiredoxin
MANYLEVGATAPDIKVTNQEGQELSLHDFKGKKVVLFFYPKANSGSCTKEAASLRDAYADLQAQGYEVLGVSPDKQKALQNFITKQELPYSLLSDPEHELTKAFGAWGEKKMYGKTYEGLLRTTFLLDEAGKVTHVIEKVKSPTHGQQVLETIG